MSLVSLSAARDEHREGCTFGPGFYRLVLSDGGRRFCQSEGEVQFVNHLLPEGSVRHVQRDGYCLDVQDSGTPDVISADRFLDMDRVDAMRELGLESEADYARAYRAVEDAVLERDRLHHGSADRPSIVIKRRGAQHVNAA
jgi:hypothetical protein